MTPIETVTVGSIIRCRYPRSGTSNMLANREGEVTFNGVSKSTNEPYITVETKDGPRNFRENRMVDLRVISCGKPKELV
jgi:hypothetical protein